MSTIGGVGALAIVSILVVASVTMVVFACVSVVERERRMLERAARRVAAAAERTRSVGPTPG
jgi:CHASE1-domain containing sensor protein